LGIRDKLNGAVAASLGLTASLLIYLNMEVIMFVSIAMTAKFSIMAICLVTGVGLLGSLVISQSEESLIDSRYLS